MNLSEVLLWVKAVLNVDFLEAVKLLTVSASADRGISGALTLKLAVFTLAQHSILHRLMFDRPYEGGPGRKKQKFSVKCSSIIPITV